MTDKTQDTIQRLRQACALNQDAARNSLAAMERCVAALERETNRAVAA